MIIKNERKFSFGNDYEKKQKEKQFPQSERSVRKNKTRANFGLIKKILTQIKITTAFVIKKNTFNGSGNQKHTAKIQTQRSLKAMTKVCERFGWEKRHFEKVNKPLTNIVPRINII